MKKLFLILSLLLLLFISCNKDDNEKATLKLSLNGSVFNIPHSANRHLITVTTNQKTWIVSEDSDWLNAIQDGNNLYLDVLENETYQERSAYVSVTASNIKKTFLVKQAINTEILQVDGEIMLGYTDFKNASKEKIIAWETAAGNVVNEKESYEGVYAFNITTENKYGLICRIYYFEGMPEVFSFCGEFFTSVDMFFNSSRTDLSEHYTKLLIGNGYSIGNLRKDGSRRCENEKLGIAIEISYSSSWLMNGVLRPVVLLSYGPIDDK